MKALVTGVSGFVGSAVARALIADGHRVRGLLRGTSNRGNLAGLDIEIRQGDLRDAVSLGDAASGCDALFHVAADYRLWVRDPAEMYAANVDGTVNIMEAALAAAVPRIVYTSSVATLGLHPDGSPADEATSVTLADMVGPYKRSKFLAEEKVRQMVAERGLPAVIVNPSTPIGPNDIKPTPTGKIIVDAASGRMPAYVDTGLNFAHVDDVARGHLLAFEKGQPGERYILGGENLSLRDFLGRLARLSGRRAPRIRLPHGAILPVAWVMERIASLGGPEPLATVDGVRLARKHMYFSCRRAAAELGYRHRPIDQALADALAWFRDRGYCP